LIDFVLLISSSSFFFSKMNKLTFVFLALMVVAVTANEFMAEVESEADKKQCHPECRWQCDDPVCPAKCHPVCERPKCQIQCEETACARCKVHCDKPKCNVRCPKDMCEKKDCPKCETVCSPANCRTSCVAPEPVCTPMCEETKCDWKCKKRRTCARDPNANSCVTNLRVKPRNLSNTRNDLVARAVLKMWLHPSKLQTPKPV